MAHESIQVPHNLGLARREKILAGVRRPGDFFAHGSLELPSHRFRVRKDRRQHLHEQIDRHGLDMTHVTERTGSPQTLVCAKTRRTFERHCARH